MAWPLQDAPQGVVARRAVVTPTEGIGTFSYCILRGFFRLMRTERLPSAELKAMAWQWVSLTRVRAVLALIRWLASLEGSVLTE
ncbi:hypothetical protein MPNT_320023 [Candidatus Methylacidithermus pantelleriae]|uniref:Uncharacterized protein n=1 Tax=Candidatus Methylacidithermus pantelleriae TaxID=2744239 RepID=A0A8J2BPR5_9BACT|nr:hypothetical protein MPNT_320023 [Candidatus Methylacidithermus pantelleriae]